MDLNEYNYDDNLIELFNQVNKLLGNSTKKSSYDNFDGLDRKVKEVLIDLDKNHNNSWAVEIFRKNISNLDKIAIFYRGNKITYSEMFEDAFRYAKSLKQLGYKKGDEIPVCVSNIPEFVYLFLAISFIGAKINSFGDWFDKDYLVSILNKSGSNFVFVSDDIYPSIKSKVEASNVNNIIMFSLTDSLMTNQIGNKFNPYDKIDSRFYKIENKVVEYQKDAYKSIMDVGSFLDFGNIYEGDVLEDCGLDDDFAISYTSGTTNPGVPKAVLHSSRSYVTLSRFKESDVSGMPSMKNLIVLAHIPTYTHMELSCGISDTLYEGCTLAMEPFYDEITFPYSLVINKPNFVPASAGAWTRLGKLLQCDSEFKDVDMPYLMIPTVTGEGLSAGEEKFLNYISRKHKFGISKLPFPLAPVTFSIGGGTSEGSGIFVTLYKSLREKKLNYLIHKNTLGLTPLKFADLEVLDVNGDYCDIGVPGLLVGNSPCSMKGYYYNKELNLDTYVVDKYGKKWLNFGTYAYKSDQNGRIKMMGRPSSYIMSDGGEKIYYYQIEDAIMRDTKNVMSCSLVKINDSSYVCHIEFQPLKKKSEYNILCSCIKRLYMVISDDIMQKLYFRVRTYEESFPLAPSGKRDKDALIAEKVSDKCIPVSSFNIYDLNNNKKKILKKN